MQFSEKCEILIKGGTLSRLEIGNDKIHLEKYLRMIKRNCNEVLRQLKNW